MVSSLQGLIFGINYATACNIWDMNLVRHTRMFGCGQQLGQTVKIILSIYCCMLTIADVYLKIQSLRYSKLTNNSQSSLRL